MPSLNIYDEDESVKEYYVPPDPASVEKEVILSTEDDVDLGSRGWVSLSDPETHKTHGLIMDSNTGLTDGEDDGIQIKSYVKQNIKLPGLEGDTGDIFATRNSYEGGKHDTTLQQGMNVAFNLEFITFQTEGYEAVDKESEIFQKIVTNIPISRENVSKEEEEKEKYTLTVKVHFAPSFPLGSMLSAVLGKNFSYNTAELYKENSFASSGAIGRLSIANMDLDFENTSLLQKIKMALGLFDWRNASFFKKILFPELETDKYLIKIYKENPPIRKNRQYIGYKIVNLKDDTSTHIYCRPEGTARLSIVDQVKQGIENVRFSLLSNDIVVAEELSDKNGSVVLKAPCYRKNPLVLRVIYQGFLIEEKQIYFGLKNNLISLKEDFSTSLYDLNLKIKDKWGLAPAVDINPTLKGDEMIDPISITAEKQTKGEYLFTRLYPEDYTLKTSYKSFVKEMGVLVDGDKTLSFEFPAEFSVEFEVMNSYGMQLVEGEVTLMREGKTIRTIIDKNGKATVSVPPGNYEMGVSSGGREVAKQNIDVKGSKESSIVTSERSSLHLIITYLGIAMVLFSIIFLIWKRNIHLGLKFFGGAILLIAIVSPWWILFGDNGVISNLLAISTYLLSITLDLTKNPRPAPKYFITPESQKILSGVFTLAPDLQSHIVKYEFKSASNLIPTTSISV